MAVSQIHAGIRLAWWRRLCLSSLVLAGITALVLWVAVADLLRQGRLETVLSAGRAELAAPLLVALVVATGTCERIWPAERRPVLARGHLQDACYLALHAVVVIPLMTLLSVGAAALIGGHARWIELPTERWPGWLLVPLTIAAMDAANWLAHYADHRLDPLWRFHALHHSQEELSVLTSFRAHPLMHTTGFLLATVPVVALMPTRPVAPVLITVYICIGTLQHANLRWTFGPLGRVLVSPAYHRLHHAPDTQAVNLGVVLTIWDVLAGYARFPSRRDEVGRTGLAGRPVPVEQDASAGPVLLLLAGQLAEPFQARDLPGRWPAARLASRGDRPLLPSRAGVHPGPDRRNRIRAPGRDLGIHRALRSVGAVPLPAGSPPAAAARAARRHVVRRGHLPGRRAHLAADLARPGRPALGRAHPRAAGPGAVRPGGLGHLRRRGIRRHQRRQQRVGNAGFRPAGYGVMRLIDGAPRPARKQVSAADPPSSLAWDTAPLTGDLDLLGNIELRLDATASAADTAWIATLQDIAPDGTGSDITSGYLRASLRAVDKKASTPGAPVLPCTTATAVPINEQVSYRVPIIATGYRLAAGHRLRLALTSDGQDPAYPAMMTFRHASVGTSTLNRIASTSRLLLPVAAGTLA